MVERPRQRLGDAVDARAEVGDGGALALGRVGSSQDGRPGA
jgi:hypothetical protein